MAKRNILVITLTPPLPVSSGGPAYVMNTIIPLADKYDYHLFTIGSEDDANKVRENAALYDRYFRSVHVERRAPIPAALSYPGKLMHALVHLWHGLPFMDLSYFSYTALRHAHAIIHSHKIDLLEIHTAHLAYFKHFFPEIPAILVGHNIESDLFPFWIPDALSLPKKYLMSRLAAFSRRNAHRVEIENAWGFEAMTFISRPDMERVSGVSEKHYLPLCFPLGEVDYESRPRKFCDMFWMGGFGWYPNAEGVLWFVRAIFPLIRDRLAEAGIRLHFLGGSPPDELIAIHDGERVFVHGFLPSIDTFLDSMHLLFVPLLSGGGVRVKILEAMSNGIPILSTAKGCEGLGVEDGRDIVVRDQAEAFAQAMLELAADYEQRRQLSLNGLELLRKHYNLALGAEIKRALYDKVCWT
jgi:glycosyltransferase involved in cell wall biosynthesis